jgi:hypothetical protein
MEMTVRDRQAAMLRPRCPALAVIGCHKAPTIGHVVACIPAADPRVHGDRCSQRRSAATTAPPHCFHLQLTLITLTLSVAARVGPSAAHRHEGPGIEAASSA